MPIILRIPELLPSEDMPQMPSTIRAQNLRPFHPPRPILLLLDRARHRVEESRPAAAGIELV
jgi:hypothetical protein